MLPTWHTSNCAAALCCLFSAWQHWPPLLAPLVPCPPRLAVHFVTFNRNFVGWIDCAKTSWKEEGRGVFFNGMTATLTRAFIVNAAVFTVYEFLLKVMQEEEQTKLTDTPAIADAR